MCMRWKYGANMKLRGTQATIIMPLHTSDIPKPYYKAQNSKFHSILQKNGQENGTEKWLLAKKNIVEKMHLKFYYIYKNYKQWKHQTKEAFYIYI